MCSSPKSGLTIKASPPLPTGLTLSNKYFSSIFRQSNANVERLQQQRLQAFNAKEPFFEQQISLERIRCPAHLIQFKQALKKLPSNQTLKVSSYSAAVINDLAACGRVLKLTVKSLRFRRQHFLYVSQSA